jgi:hypothetical protein
MAKIARYSPPHKVQPLGPDKAYRAGHTSQDAAPESLVLPTAHSSHEMVVGVKDPAEQTAHGDAASRSWSNNPGSHCVHIIDPTVAYVPAAQPVQMGSVSADSCLYLPASQAKHVADILDCTFPAGQTNRDTTCWFGTSMDVTLPFISTLDGSASCVASVAAAFFTTDDLSDLTTNEN